MTAEPPPGQNPYQPGPPPPGGYQPPPPPPPGGYPPPGYGPYGAGPQGAPVPPGAPAPLALWWERWVARIIDFIIFFVVYYILLSILNSIFKPSFADLLQNPTGTLFMPYFLAGVIAYGAYTAYDYVLHSKDGQTLGKKVMKIKVVGVGGAALDSSALMKRSALYPGVMVLMALVGASSLFNFLAGILMLVIAVMVVADQPLHQGLHDKVAGTIVVKAPQ
ncbi:hypothetical protein Pth03_08630 [Planotetraspora thailandica]|uniref:RDD domain-containing protein n=1 Tax=Planotetraspora thailandica TaxID=487172 RepID=A0A8J3XTS4_9ACTN|nr:RDD family protein [Planotetraspora thailandica]GII52474.1 hypothetical protein Pth03_08630 [Planotetraspora thailandica]